MTHPYLLMIGHNYYPAGLYDWVACFKTLKEAKSQITIINKKIIYKNNEYDWYEIVDLRSWQKDDPPIKNF